MGDKELLLGQINPNMNSILSVPQAHISVSHFIAENVNGSTTVEKNNGLCSCDLCLEKESPEIFLRWQRSVSSRVV